MKYSKLALACTLALATGQAAALLPNAPVASTNILYVSGASAPTATFYGAMRAACQPGTTHIYENSSVVRIPGATSAGNFFAYFCTFNNTGNNAALDGQNVLVYHSVDGGSFNSIGPVLDTNGAVQFPISFLRSIQNTATSGCSATAVNNTDGIPTFTSCGSAIRNRPAVGVGASDGGLSDVEPGLFVDLLTTLNAGDLTLNDLTTAPSNVGQVFGLLVSDWLYQAMQNQQKTTGKIPSTCVTGDYTPGACQPSIDKQEYASIVAASGNHHTDWQFLVGTAGAAHNVNLCRRVSTSGSQASSNAYFLNNPCGRGGSGGQLAPAVASTVAPFIVSEGSGTGNVRTCLNTAGNQPAITSTNAFAIGVVSMENTILATDRFHYVKLSGVSPNARQVQLGGAADIANSGAADGWEQNALHRQSAIDGKYEFAFELVANWIADNGGVKDQFFTQLNTLLATPTAAPGVLGTGLTGLYITPLSGFTNPDYPDLVSRGTRFGNSCQPAQQ